MDLLMQEILKHMAILNSEMGGVQNSMASMQIDIEILKVQMSQSLMYQKIVFGFFLTSFTGILIFIFRRMFIRVFNNKK